MQIGNNNLPVFILSRYVSMGEQANKPSPTTSALSNPTLTTSNMFSILSDAMSESKKKGGVPRIGVSTSNTTETNANSSRTINVSKGTGIEALSKKPFTFSREVYSYCPPG